jgi:putative nucleotidyltransferase with HDIG domain
VFFGTILKQINEMSFTVNSDYNLCVERMGRDLPALPEVISELTTNLNDPNSATFTVERLMNSDQSLSMKVLTVANTTAFRGDRQRVTEVHEAIGMLGYDNIRNIILTSSVMNLFTGISMDVMSFEDLWRHSLITAELTKTLAEKTQCADSDKAFICGLLHDIGKVGRVKGDGKFFEADLSQAIDGNLSLFEVEAENQSLRHDRLGQALCRKWNLPSVICNVVGNHHEFELVDRDEGMQEQDHEITDLIIVANALSNYWGFGFTSHSSVRELPRTLLNRIDLNQEKLAEMEDELRDRIASVIEFNRILISLPIEPGTRIKKNLGIKEDKDLFKRSLSGPDPSVEDVKEDEEEDLMGAFPSNDFFASFTPLTEFSSQFSSAVRERLTPDQEKIFLDSLGKRFPQDKD